MLKLKLQYFSHLMWITDSLENTLKLGKIEGRRRSGRGGWDSWMASQSQWTWIWASSRRWWRTGKPDVLQSMGSQRVGHDWETEQQNQEAGKWKQKASFCELVFMKHNILPTMSPRREHSYPGDFLLPSFPEGRWTIPWQALTHLGRCSSDFLQHMSAFAELLRPKQQPSLWSWHSYRSILICPQIIITRVCLPNNWELPTCLSWTLLNTSRMKNSIFIYDYKITRHTYYPQ